MATKQMGMQLCESVNHKAIPCSHESSLLYSAVLCVELFDMKTRYEESDNIVVRATRTVTDKMSELFGTLSVSRHQLRCYAASVS